MLPKSLNTEQDSIEFHISINETANIQLKLDLFPWSSLFHLIFELYLDAAIRPIFDCAVKLWSMCFVKAVLLLALLLADSIVYV